MTKEFLDLKKVYPIYPADILIDSIKEKFKGNQNFICGILGKPGTGKSYVGMEFCERISQNFNLEYVVFSRKSFLQLLSNGKLKSGDSVLWDEIEVNMYSRDFMELQNKLINLVLATFRTDNIALFYTAPSLSWVDIGVARLNHAVIETINFNKVKKINYFRFKWAQTNPLTSKIYYRKPRFRTENGKLKVERMHFSISKFADDYEIIRKKFADELQVSTIENLDRAEGIEEHKLLDDETIMNYYTEQKRIPRTVEMQTKWKVGLNRASRIRFLLTQRMPGIEPDSALAGRPKIQSV